MEAWAADLSFAPMPFADGVQCRESSQWTPNPQERSRSVRGQPSLQRWSRLLPPLIGLVCEFDLNTDQLQQLEAPQSIVLMLSNLFFPFRSV
jgi:hypothetical protein